MTVPWKEEGADGDVTERLCIVGRDDEAILKAPGVMECSLDVVCRRSAKPFWNETELDDARSIGKASYPLLVISNSILAVTGVPGMFLYSKYNSRLKENGLTSSYTFWDPSAENPASVIVLEERPSLVGL